LIFGEKKLKHKTLTLASFMVAFGATLSAFWIIVANSWQQTPAGFEIVNGRAELTDFFAALFNPSTIPRYTHTVSGAFVTAGFLMFGIAAYYILKREHVEFAKRTFRAALIVAAVAALGQLGTGHHHAIQVAETQPAKLAAFEGLFETQRNAPLVLIGVPDEAAGETVGLAVPSMLSFLVGFSGDTEVRGLRDFPRDEWPPILASFFPFHLMFILGMYFIGFTLAGVFLLWRKTLFDMDSGLSRLYMKAALYSIPLPIIANILGWFAAEMGRQPWAVQGLLRVEDAISTAVLPSEILFSIILFTLIYTLLLVLWVFLIKLKIKAGPDAEGVGAAKGQEVAS
jgi:cytochrome bd ubiquinol oxidase subunit I